MVCIRTGIRTFLPAAFVAALGLGGTDAWSQTYHWNPSMIGTFDAQRSFNWTLDNTTSGARNYPVSDRDDNFESATLNSAWTFQDRDRAEYTASYSLTENAGKITIKSQGDDIWDNVNLYAGVYRKDITGNFDVSVKVESQTVTHPWAKAGIMVWNDYEDFTKGGGFAAFATPDNGLVAHVDSLSPQGFLDAPTGGNPSHPTTFPCWLRVTRVGDQYRAYYRKDTTQVWTLIHNRSFKPLGATTNGSSHIGLVVTSHNPAQPSTAVFDDFKGGGNVVPQDLDLKWTNITTNPSTLAGNLGAKTVDFTGYTGNFSFGAFSLTVSGNANFGTTVGINPGTGKLILNGSGTLTPKANDTLPAIQKTGSGEVVLAAGIPLRADSLHIGGGTFDLNSNNAFVQQFTAAGGSGVLEGFTAADDSLVVFTRADFAGLGTLTAGLGTVAIKAVGSGKNVSFNPADKPFRNVTLWTVPTGASDARVQVGPGNLNVAGNLEFRNQRAEAGFDGDITFLPSSPNVTVGQNVTAANDGTGANWQVLRMGNGTWKVAGSLAFPLNGGSADNSILELTGAGTQTVAVPGNPLNVVKHTGSGTVQLTAAFSADSLLLTAGVFDLSGNNVTLAGDLVVDGAPNLVTGLGGRTLDVGGNAQLKGRSGALLLLNPASAWKISVAGSLNAEYANLANSNATGGSTGQADANSTDGGSNLNWSFNGGPITQIPSIIGEPGDTTVIEGQNASFTAVSSGGGLTFVWQRMGSPDTIGTGAILNLNNVLLSQNGQLYRCIVSNSAGKDTTRQAKLTVKPKPVPAKVTAEPLDKLVEAGTGATFSVVAEGDATITYAWYKKGVAASVGNAKDLVLTGLAKADSGSLYYCIVENASGKDTTREALLEVVPKPVPAKVTTEPKDSTVFVTEKVSFTVAAEGNAPLAYKWEKKGDTTTLGTEPTLSFTSAKPADAGAYRCIVSNGFGKDTTREATLTVKPAPVAPTIIREPADTLVKVDGKASFSAGVLGTAPLSFEWRKAGDTAVLSRDSVFVIASAKDTMSGNSYFVVVSNSTGIKDTSTQARLTVRSCDSLTIQVSAGTTANEGAAVKVWGKSVCADRTEWSVVSGPAPRLLDPSVDTLAFKAPRVTGDAEIKYQYSAWFGESVKSQEVLVKVKEAIPDPSMGIASSQVTWTGVKPLVVKPQVFNKAQLDLFTAYPLRYLWTLEPAMADSTLAADSLSLGSPSGEGRMDVILCLDNGGKAACDTLHVDIEKNTPVSLARRGILLPGGMLLQGSRLTFGQPGRVAVWSLMGRLLFEARGREGASVEIPAPVLWDLLRSRARLEFRSR